ncbi:MAG: class I SAM-dependent methyltransferase [Paracoccaceae bacterium]
MTGLTDILIRQIQSTGPLSVAEYMNECLLHPEFGYYSTRDPFGKDGDFTTAPEISQMFGELLGLCLAQTWLDQGQPEQFTLAELGPGRGTLMADILRVTKAVPGFQQAANIVLMEASAALREKQKSVLNNYDVDWIDNIGAMPAAPLYLVANEFFDALPIRQFDRDNSGWREHQITTKDRKLLMALSAPAPIAALDHRLNNTAPGDTVEICPSASGIIQTVSEVIGEHGGVAIVVDYGNWRSLGDTFQAIKGHKTVSPFATPGKADLTAHVDFEALTVACRNANVTGMTRQSDLLMRLGIETRAKHLASNLVGDKLKSHDKAYRRLTHPLEMGTLFKAIAIYPKNAAAPPGFDP